MHTSMRGGGGGGVQHGLHVGHACVSSAVGVNQGRIGLWLLLPMPLDLPENLNPSS